MTATTPPPMHKLTLQSAWATLHRRCDIALDALVTGPHWKSKALLFIMVLTLFRAFPSYDALNWTYVRATWQNVQPLLDHPLADPAKLPGSALDPRLVNLTFRRTVLVLARLLHLGEAALLILFGLLGVLLLWEALAVTYAVTASKRTAVFLCLGAACIWPGEAAFHDLRGGYFDAAGLCLLVLALSRSSMLMIAGCVFLAAWTDERALIASYFVYLFFVARSPCAGIRKAILGKPGAVIAAWVGYFVTRAYYTATHSLTATSGGIGLSTFFQQANVIPLGIWTGLEGLWLIVFCGICAMIVQKRYLFAASFGGVLSVLMLSALAITDVTRTVSYCFPAVFVAISFLAESAPMKQVEKLTMIAGLVSFLVPTYYVQGSTGFWWLYPLPVHVIRWLSMAG
jgi:hypothetical protein